MTNERRKVVVGMIMLAIERHVWQKSAPDTEQPPNVAEVISLAESYGRGRSPRVTQQEIRQCLNLSFRDLVESAVPTNTYRFRAECRFDVFRLLDKIDSLELIRLELNSDSMGLPDVEVTLTLRTTTLPGLKNLMSQVPDSHVMIETIALPDQYTGERTYTA